MGLLNHIVPLAELENTVEQLANAAQQNSLAENYQTLYGKGFDRYETMLRSDDAVEGPQAFAEKRLPKWTGR